MPCARQARCERAEVRWPNPHEGADARLSVAFDVPGARCEATTLSGGVWNRGLWRQLLANADALVLVLDPQSTQEGANREAMRHVHPGDRALAKHDRRIGMTRGDMQAYKDLNRELSDPIPEDLVRGPEVHPLRTPNSKPGHGQQIHGHVGDGYHIPIID